MRIIRSNVLAAKGKSRFRQAIQSDQANGVDDDTIDTTNYKNRPASIKSFANFAGRIVVIENNEFVWKWILHKKE